MPNSASDVAGGAPNAQSYKDNSDGTVTDNGTGLMWQKSFSTNKIGTWASAAAYCAGLSLASHNDWRLPSRIELVSILDIDQYPTINPIFTSTPPAYFWSSTSVTDQPATWGVWGLSFESGTTILGATVWDAYVRCVR
jgi:hypothetical protein